MPEWEAVSDLAASMSWSRNQCQQVLAMVRDLERQLEEAREENRLLYQRLTAAEGKRDE